LFAPSAVHAGMHSALPCPYYFAIRRLSAQTGF